MPSFSHHTAKCDNRPAPVVANGEPLSVRSAPWQPILAKRPLKPGPTPRSLGATIRQHNTATYASAIVSGSHRVPSVVRNHPLKSAVHTSLGAAAAANGWVSGTTYRSRRRGALDPAAAADRPSCWPPAKGHAVAAPATPPRASSAPTAGAPGATPQAPPGSPPSLGHGPAVPVIDRPAPGRVRLHTGRSTCRPSSD